MGMRRRAREIALQVLYQNDVQPDLPVETALARFWTSFVEETRGSLPDDPLAEVRAYADLLVRGVVEKQAEIDARIVSASRNWRIERMARVDRNLLRLAVFEVNFRDDVPAKVAINEAIEIAKRFGAHETPAFVNGILDRVLAGKA